MTNLAIAEGREVARPLHVIEPLIKKDLADAKEAADAAAQPYYVSVGNKLKEAKDGHEMSIKELCDWSQRKFNIGRTQTCKYLSLANTTFDLSSARSMSDAIRHIGGTPRGAERGGASWHGPIKEQITAASNIRNLHAEAMARAEERDVERKLAQRLIDIGFKALATEFHPDKPGGSKDAMSRLNRVRDKLKSVYA